MKVNIIEAMENYVEEVRTFEEFVEETLGEDWSVLVHAINTKAGSIPVHVWNKKANKDFEENGKIYAISFILSRGESVLLESGNEEGNQKYSEDEIEIVRKAILRVLNGDKQATNKFVDIPRSTKKDFIDEEIERIENRNKQVIHLRITKADKKRLRES